MGEEEAKGVGGVAFEEGSEAILLIQPDEAVTNSFILAGEESFLDEGELHLQSEFDHLDGRGDRLGDVSSQTPQEELLEETMSFS